MNSNIKRTIISIVMSLIVLIVAVVASFAWLYEFREPVVSDININVGETNEIKIAPIEDGVDLANVSWTYSYEIPEITTQFQAVSSDGLSFYAPNYETKTDNDNGNIVTYNELVGYKILADTEVGSYMYYQKFYFSSEQNINLYYTKDCFVIPADLQSNFNQAGFSADAVAGAMRVVFQVLDVNDKVIQSVIWIPNVNYEITKDTDSDYYIFNANGTPEATISFVDSTDLDANSNAKTRNVETKGLSELTEPYQLTNYTRVIYGEITKDTFICSLSAGVSKIAIGFYMEGTDRECNPLVGGGNVKLNLYFNTQF